MKKYPNDVLIIPIPIANFAPKHTATEELQDEKLPFWSAVAVSFQYIFVDFSLQWYNVIDEESNFLLSVIILNTQFPSNRMAFIESQSSTLLRFLPRTVALCFTSLLCVGHMS